MAGALPLRDVPAADFFAGQRFRLVRFGLSTPVAGTAVLCFSDPEGVAMFLGGEPVEVTAESVVDLHPVGTAVEVLQLDLHADSLS